MDIRPVITGADAFFYELASMSKYGLHGKLTAKPGQSDQLAAVLLEAARLVSTAPGCQLYAVSKSEEDANSVWVTEIWDSKEAHDESLKAPEVRALIGEAMPLLDGPPAGGQVLEVLGGVGVS